MKVIDANVAFKWFVPEAGAEKSRRLLMSDSLISPALIRLEVLSSFLRCAKDGRSTKEEADRLCRHWLTFLEDRDVVLYPDEKLVDVAIRFGLKLNHHLFDCFYLALCNLTEAPLVTFDAELARKAKQVGVRCELLKED